MKKIHITDIEWDTDDVEGEKPDLPTEWDTEVTEEEYDTWDLDDMLADRLSDEFGFCVDSFHYDPVDDNPAATV